MVGHTYVMYDYVAWWAIGVRDLYEYTGDKAIVEEFFPVVVEQVEFLQKRRSPRGLIDVRLEFGAPFTGRPPAAVSVRTRCGFSSDSTR